MLVSHREKYAARIKSEKTARALLKVGSAVQAAVERFVTVGESIADENAEIQPEMYEACQEARSAGGAIANLSDVQMKNINENSNGLTFDKSILVRAARQLLSSVTRVLLLADRVVVMQILKAEDKVAYSLTRVENTSNFTQFVSIFTQFGSEMVDLAHKTGDRQQDLKSDKRRVQMQVSRNILEKFTLLLLTSSKTLLRHPDCESARQTRDGVFRQMRIALQLVGLCACDGVIPFDAQRFLGLSTAAGMTPPTTVTFQYDEDPLDIGLQLTASFAIKQLLNESEQMRNAGESNAIESSVQKLCCVLKDLRKRFQLTAMDQVSDVFRTNEDQLILNSIKACSVSGDIDGVEQYVERLREHAEHVQEVCRLLYHISLTDALHVHTGHAERSLRTLSPLLILAGRTLCLHPSSRIARENLEVFCDAWAEAVTEVSRLAKESDAVCCGRVAAENQAYMSLPKPGKHGSTAKPMKPVTLDVEKIAKVGLEMKLLTSEVDAEAEKWDEYAENDIVKRAKNMSSMAYNMYLFTRGDGPLKTTHDLFTQAEFFAEEANKMYRTVREFSYEVPGSSEKNELLPVLDRIPVHCQQLQVLVKSPTVGKSATFNKVDSVIQETKNLMNEIAKLVTACFSCATKYDIEFRGASMSAARLPLLNGGTGELDSLGGGSFRSTGDTSSWHRTPSVRRSKSQPRVIATEPQS